MRVDSTSQVGSAATSPEAQDRVFAERSEFPQALCPCPRIHRDRGLVRQSTSEVDAQIFRTRGQEGASLFQLGLLVATNSFNFNTHRKEAAEGQ